MLYRLEIENFHSVRDRQVLDVRGPDGRVPKVIALFGANGSGKSIALKAPAFIAWFMRDSFQHNPAGLPCQPFNDEESANRPVRLAIELDGVTDRSARSGAKETLATALGVFRYELEIQPKDGIVRTVTHEALRMKRYGQGKWLRVFERASDGPLAGSKTFPLTGFSQVVDKVREDASVVATLALFEHEASKILSDAARRVYSNILMDRVDFDDQSVIQHLAQNPAILEKLNTELQRIDVGVETLRIVPTPTGLTAMFRHQGLHGDMPLPLESHGTRSFIRVFPFLLLALQTGGIAIIDELDVSIHPLILPEIVRWFYDPYRNPHDAQLWMSCHSASLLDNLSKEAVVFCEKDQHSRSRIYSLADIGGVRGSDNLYKKYLRGVYGAVPHIG